MSLAEPTGGSAADLASDDTDDEGFDDDTDDEGFDDDEHEEGCCCDDCCVAQLVGLVHVAGDDPETYLARAGTHGLAAVGRAVLDDHDLGEAVLPSEPAVALEGLLSEEEIQAMQACAYGGSLSAERRRLLTRVNWLRPDLVTSSDLFLFVPVLTSTGRALLVTLGRLPATPSEVAP